MSKSSKRYVGTMVLIATVFAGTAWSQGQPAPQGSKSTTRPRSNTQPNPAPLQAILDDQNARETRDQLQRLFTQYPPSLEQVLKLDPSLLKNPEYLAPYPGLASFFELHPEIAHNPSFFLGDVWVQKESNESESFRMWKDVAEGVTIFLGVFTAIGVFAWLIRTLIDYRRWHRITRIQTDVHSKLLDRFSNNEDLLAYIQTPAGKKFLESAPIPLEGAPRSVSAPIGRIMWSIQTGMVLAFAGCGLFYAFSRFAMERVAEPFFVISILAIALGVGFIASAAVSYVFSLRLGLLDQTTNRAGNSSREASTQP